MGYRERIADALSVLTDREKNIFIMHAVQNISYEEIAALFNIKKEPSKRILNDPA
ncbi:MULTISPECIES: sigma factor-like helix-turn-helix DNA-binding protein [Bacillus]|uniref:sigma factor-like helix-turn-helix DNA-binding protein n=1 Tax=Bacillus TaxID=1386 RepID=UPI000B00C35A|nr:MULTISPECIES: sigma factor-like helix-turn-helix DNA-binding protein [Bacillus]MDV5126237.1 sigma factor-like helix-turn-helix DNA-binding protein [Bacillus velezensis]MED4525883.1 sigma factor-like helix-turn-helix DNA-binding protein [Bacillus velezensis]WBQ90563.1 hypothetical protein OVA33_10350 [Bacillus sp. KICET-1]